MNCVEPRALTIITTYTCNASCKGCCFNCGPSRKERLSFSEIKDIIDQSLLEFPSIEVVIFTGGEPFLLEEDLLESVRYVTNHKRKTRVVTNGYWATSYKKAYLILNKYKISGLTEINYSTGDAHQKFVPLDNIVNAARAALDLSFPLAINVETNKSKKFHFSTLQNDPRLLKYKQNKNFWINSGLWVPDEKDKDFSSYYDNKKSNFKYVNKNKGCTSLFSGITISPDKKLFSCCGFSAKTNKYLQFGSLETGDLRQCYNRQFDDLLKIWLFTLGPESVAEFINKYTDNNIIDITKKHPCGICREVYSNPEYIKILRDNCRSVYPTIFINFNLKLNLSK